MPTLNLKPTHQPVKEYYRALADIQQMSLLHEGAVAPQFANLLRACASRMGWTFAEQHQIPRKGRKPLRADGVFLDQFKLRHGIWEAKDSKDDLAHEVKKKFSEGYPQDNILFQAPARAILVQNGRFSLRRRHHPTRQTRRSAPPVLRIPAARIRPMGRRRRRIQRARARTRPKPARPHRDRAQTKQTIQQPPSPTSKRSCATPSTPTSPTTPSKKCSSSTCSPSASSAKSSTTPTSPSATSSPAK